MKRLLPLALLPLLAACEAPSDQPGAPHGGLAGLFQHPEAEPPAPEPLPPQVLAALPAGVPPTVVQQGADGCYLLTIEVTDPPTGYPLRDAAGTPVCEGGAVAMATDPAPIPGASAPLAPGSITPPAPIAPLNPT
ncbi:hypothetical protein Rumeso_04821 [Rubellimicrobium mesophilum DSM 19309]|uniref:Lipoprotein n=1 Tax=Rubellimicrobium mesophilum DSM 19309 TaxID=442562 RepID=A0A017HF59_9RHOB|nr:hypothetical protein [Rubellimicrobium mesophilum]EYD72945.1 hypothetical protein Rumeso_04821 [Rubellimicrobium mesophilum DSM 19309]